MVLIVTSSDDKSLGLHLIDKYRSVINCTDLNVDLNGI